MLVSEVAQLLRNAAVYASECLLDLYWRHKGDAGQMGQVQTVSMEIHLGAQHQWDGDCAKW